MESYHALLRWAGEGGVQLTGIEPRRIPGRGIGLVATRKVKKNDVVLDVPVPMLRTLDTVPKRIARQLPEKRTIHALLAADLALNQSDKFIEWIAVTPTKEEIWASLPLTWDPELHEFLPKRARDLLKSQTTKFKEDWAMVHKAFPDLSHDDYLYSWLLANTRTFHYTTPATAKFAPADCMALQPVADLFNHADTGCHVAFDATSFTFTADRDYASGEEVFISYGSHSNDFLLVEYGFVLAQNRWDEVCIDDIILPQLSTRQREQLDSCGFLGRYMIDADAVCHRTQVAMRLLCVSALKWQAFVDGMDDGEADQTKVDRRLVPLLRSYLKKVETTLAQLDLSTSGEAMHRAMLVTRWKQIQSLLKTTISRISS